MLKQFRFFQSWILILSILSIASCAPDFDPPPSVTAPGALGGQILYDFQGNHIHCEGLLNATAGLFTTHPSFWITGADYEIDNIDPNNPNIDFTYRIDFLLHNVTDINAIVGANIPLEDDVVDPSVDMYLTIAISTPASDMYEFTSINFNITSVSNSKVSGTFSGTVEDVWSGGTHQVTNGKVIDVDYASE